MANLDHNIPLVWRSPRLASARKHDDVLTSAAGVCRAALAHEPGSR